MKYNFNRFNLLTNLLPIINSDRTDADFVIAKYLTENLERLGELSIYQVAEDCYVSRSSVQRFIKNIGFEGFGQVRELAQETVVHQKGFIQYTDHTQYPQFLTVSIEEMLKDVSQTAQVQSFQEMTEMIMKAKNVVLLCAEDSSAACRMFQLRMLSIGKLVRVLTSANTNLSLLNSLTEEDLMIVCSVTGNYAIIINDIIGQYNTKKCLVTLNRTMLFTKQYDLIHYMGNDISINSRDVLVVRKNVYNDYGLIYFFDLLFHNCYSSAD